MESQTLPPLSANSIHTFATPSTLQSPLLGPSFTPLRQSSSQTCRPSTSSLPRSHKRAKATRQGEGSRPKRETSVPLLSQQLSSFSLRQDPSPEMSSAETVPGLTSPFKYTPNPTSASLATPYTSTFRHHLSPEPILHKSKSAGPKFVSQTAKGQPHINPSPTPKAGDDRMGDWGSLAGSDEPSLEWTENREWIPPLRSKKDQHEDGHMYGSLQRISSRRDADYSTSSTEFSGSGTSSASLLSLERSSMEHQNRPNIITQWDENSIGMEDSYASRPSTESRPRQSALRAYKSQGGSTDDDFKPSVGLPSTQTTLQPFPNDSPFCLDSGPHKPTRLESRASAFLPRLLLTKKKSSVALRGYPNASSKSIEDLDDEEMMSDVEDLPHQSPSRAKNFWDRAKMRVSHHPFESSGLGLGIELGPRRPFPTGERVEEGRGLAVSVGSESSGEQDLSPIKAVFSRPSMTTLASPPVQESISRTSTPSGGDCRPPMPRRKSVVGSMLLRMPRASSPSIPTLNALRGTGRPLMKRGITDPTESLRSGLLTANAALNTPTAMSFADVKPSPSVFASAGLVKKKSRFSGVEIPKFGSEPIADAKRKKSSAQFGSYAGSKVQPPSPTSPLLPMRPIIPSAAFSTFPSSNSQFAQKPLKTRGLKKKRSTMFKAGNSISSLDMIRGNSRGSVNSVSLSPVTPTKHDSTALAFGITTPSPVRPPVVYPFASANPVDLDLFSTPPSSKHKRPGALDAPIAERYRTMLAGSPVTLRETQHGPIARASNPMLAVNIRAAAQIRTPARGHISQDASKFGARAKFAGEGITRLETDFVMVDNLGAGAFSQVWKVREKKTGKVFAVKAGKSYTGVKNRLRQLEEIAILRQLSLDSHPNVIQYVDSWESHSRLYILTDLVECGDFSSFLSLLSDHGGIREARVWKSLVELANGIDHIHKHHFLHLDIKPSNILINREGGLVIADLGMAVICGDGPDGRMIGGMSPALPERDEEGGFVWDSVETPIDDGKKLMMVPSPILDREVEGDREYLCPEALSEASLIGKGADVFSLGILLLEAALNVVLPSNGDAWVQLRNDDFSNLDGIYIPRSCSASFPTRGPPADDPNMPVLSNDIIYVIRGMMKSKSDKRWGLSDVWQYPVVEKVKATKRGKALVEESEDWLKNILGEEVL